MAANGAPASGWGGTGHRFITDGAIDLLPVPLRTFFAANRTTIVNSAGDEPAGRHYIDIDYYPEFHAGTFPRDLNVLIQKYGAAVVESNGQGPWTYAAYVTSLTQKMAAAKTPADWQNLRITAAEMAHYIEDLHNPLHTTLNYDGQLTGNNGIHARYESNMVSRNLTGLAIAPTTASYIPSVIDFVFDGIDQRYPYVAAIIAADDSAPGSSYNTTYYNWLWSQTGSFTDAIFQDAAEAVASSWLTAWINAGAPRTFLANAADFDGDGGVDRDDLAVWQGAHGGTWQADANRDGRTDGTDFVLWQRQLGSGVSAASATSVLPEPHAALTMALAMPLLIAARRRRHAACLTKAAMAEALGLEVALCGTHTAGAGW